jgi:hypothetical protein
LAGQLTRRLVIAATLVESILAGGNVNRALIDMPAWQRTGSLSWSAFSRNADLGPVGRILYPLEGIAGAILSVAAALSFRRDGGTPISATVPVYGAALLAIGGLVVTTRAAPRMLSLPRVGGDPVATQQALDGFQFWGNIRAVFQVLAFITNLWSLVTISAQSDKAISQ